MCHFWSWRSAGIMSSGLFDPASLQPDVFDVWGLRRSGGPKVKLKVSLRKIIVFLPQWFIAPADWCFTRLPQGAGTSRFFVSLYRGTTERTSAWKCKGLRQQCVCSLGFHEVKKKWATVTASPLIKFKEYLCGANSSINVDDETLSTTVEENIHLPKTVNFTNTHKHTPCL